MDNIKICSVLIKRMWPILMFYGALIMVDACFWTIGSVMVDQHKEEFPAIGLLFIIYLLPSLIFAPLGLQVAKLLGKKRTAFIAGIVTGLMYFLGGLSGSLGLFLIFVAIGSLCREIAHSEIRGATEDYCSRLDDKASPLVGMITATNSVGYIIGPMIAGLSGQYLGYQRGIGVFGFGLAVSAIIGLIVVPRKLKIPQTEIHNLLAVE